MIALDFETFSGVNLKDVSYNQYFNDPQYHPQRCGFFGTFPPAAEDLSPADRRAAYDTLLPYQMPNGHLGGQLDFLQHPEHARAVVEAIHVLDRLVVLHNRSFDTKAISALVPKSITSQVSYIDTAMLSRRLGGSSNLDSALRQWMNNSIKMPEGRRLLKKFSLCDTPPTAEAVKHDPDWALYGEYAYQDARLAFKLAQFFQRGRLYTGGNQQHTRQDLLPHITALLPVSCAISSRHEKLPAPDQIIPSSPR